MADIKGDNTPQKSSCQDPMEETAKLTERQDGSEHVGVKASDTASSTSPSPQNPLSGFQASANANSSNARPNLSYAFGGNPFTLHSSFPSSESRLAPSKFSSSFNSGPAMNSSSTMSLSKPVLRPSQLMGASSPFSSSSTAPSTLFQSKPGYTLNPSKLGNPFAKVSAETKVDDVMEAESGPSKEKDHEVTPKTSSESTIVVAPKFVPLGKKESADRTDLNAGSSSLSPAVSIQTSPHSKPNTTESASPVSFVARASHSAISASPASTGFVFGQNLHERV
ncbi:uncharacterized protein, partial [Hetaerina americana]|uniref:uncharacterized protein n=1 Tax=Hetaerina americana TaxID=62018 RepID=UPI003A7F2ED4